MSQMRSAPTSCGASTASGTVSLLPGSTLNGCTGGTTFEMATPVMPSCSMPRVLRSVRMKTPYSSAVCSRRVVSLHDASSRGPLKIPILVLVLPTSITSSMLYLRRDLARDDPHSLAAVRSEQQGAVVGQPHRDALAAVDRARAVADALRAPEPGRAERAESSLEESRVPRVERRQHRPQHVLDGVCAARLDHHRGGKRPDRIRE